MYPSKTILMKAAVTASLVLLASCGGGDDEEAGAPVEFNVVPSSFGYIAAEGSTECVQGTAADKFLINGGAAPYTAESTSPNVVRLMAEGSTVRQNKVTVNNRGGGFTVYFEGGCTTDEGTTILVKDALNRQFTVTVTNVLEEEEGA